MKFAFSTVAAPKWDFQTIVSRAKEYGYDGIEIRGFLNEPALCAADVFLTDPAKIKSMFAYHGIEIACLSSSIAMTGRKRHDRAAADDCRRFIDTATALGCTFVKVFDTQVRPGQTRGSAGILLGDWLAPLGDYAADRDICIVVENALSFRQAKEMWLLLDRLSHPSIACCWDVANASMVGETPALSLPTLNSRIQYVQVKDANLGPLGASFTKLGEGTIPVKDLLTRLRGIGYTGWTSFEWDKAWLPGLAEPEEILPDAIKTLREWTKPQLEENGDAKPTAHAAAH
jgi:sugar phosphate isomerase/epimerase